MEGCVGNKDILRSPHLMKFVLLATENQISHSTYYFPGVDTVDFSNIAYLDVQINNTVSIILSANDSSACPVHSRTIVIRHDGS